MNFDFSGLDIYSSIYQVLNFFISVLIVGVVVVIAIFFLRAKNQRDVEPDKKTGERKILVTFWTEGGEKYEELCRYKGNQVTTRAGGSYFIASECIYQGKWKPGQPGMIQVGVSATTYRENNREPLVSKNPDSWLESPNKKQITAYMQRTALNESFQRNLLAMSEKVWADIASMAKFIKNVPYLFYLCIGILVLLVLNLYMNYQIQATISTLRSMFGG